MAFGSFDNKGSGGHTVSEINMVPLIDVMLVLLVIFIITAPLLAHSIKINMPQVSAEQLQEDPKTIDLAIDASGSIFWDEQPITLEDLPFRFHAVAGDKPQPEIRIRADQNTRYETLAKVMASARRSGMGRIGFVTTPAPAGAAPAPGAAQPAAPGAQPAATGAHPAAHPAAQPAKPAPAKAGAQPAAQPAR